MIQLSIFQPPMLEPVPDAIPHLPVVVTLMTGRRRASARIYNETIEVMIPHHWPKSFKADVARDLGHSMQKQFHADMRLVRHAEGPWLTFADQPRAFGAWVSQWNQATLNVPVKKIRIGNSKYTQLAQMNVKTHVMTVSRYCLTHVPESALRYLILHELAHLKVPNHSPAFWAWVKPHIPNLRYEKRLIQAVHRVRVYESQMPCQQPSGSLGFGDSGRDFGSIF